VTSASVVRPTEADHPLTAAAVIHCRFRLGHRLLCIRSPMTPKRDPARRAAIISARERQTGGEAGMFAWQLCASNSVGEIVIAHARERT